MKQYFPGFLLLASALTHAQSYTFAQFDAPTANGTFPTGINNSGQIVGNYSDTTNKSHAFLRSANGTTFTEIVAPGALPFTTKANGINNLGQVVGSYMDTVGFHGYIRNADGTFTTFDIISLIPTPGPNADASAINDYGEVVGPASDLVTGSNGYIRSADGATLTLVQASFFGDTSPAAIHNSGEIAGFGLDGSSAGTQHGFLRSRDGSYARFDLPGTTSYTRILGVNNDGKFAGELMGMNMGFVSNADGSFALLGGYPVSAINDAGEITGTYYTGTPPTHGFIGVPGTADTRPAIRTLLPGVLTASGFGGATTIAPGTWIEIYGNNLAPTTRPWRASDFIGNTAPKSLDGVKVSVNGSLANISYISPGQVNAFVPTVVSAAVAQVTVTTPAHLTVSP
jgi:probable HAF family extracellular repeat protein